VLGAGGLSLLLNGWVGDLKMLAPFYLGRSIPISKKQLEMGLQK